MAAVVAIDISKRRVLVKFAGALTLRDIENYADQLRVDPRFDPAFSEIVDLREVKKVTLAPKQLIRLADHVDPFSSEAKRAFIARNQEHVHAAKVHRMLRPGNDNIRIFFSLKEAEAWVNG